MSVRGVSLGRAGAPSFGAVLPGIPMVRRSVGHYDAVGGFGLYGSTSMVRATIYSFMQPYDPTVLNVWRTTPTNTGWLVLTGGTGNLSCRIFDTTATVHTVAITPTPWPGLNISVYTYDGVTVRGYQNGILVASTPSPNIDPAPAGNTLQLFSGSDSTWIAHLLASDTPGAFLNDAGVLAWTRSAASSLMRRTALVPWTGCQMWYDAGQIGRLTWTDRIGGIVATANAPGNLSNMFVRSLPTSSVPRIA